MWNIEFPTKFTESDLQKGVAVYLDDLERMGLLAWFHPMNEGKRTPRAGAKAKSHGMKAGDPDCIIFLREGKPLFIELKTTNGQLSVAQKVRHTLYRKLGYEVYVVKTANPRGAVKAVEDILRAAGVKL